MIFPQITADEWLLRYPHLQIKVVNCKHCEGRVYVNKPFISKDYVGFISERCSNCNLEHNATCAMPVSKEEIEEWRRLIS
jgi:hypothetical protein